MKKLLFILVFLVTCIVGNAQDSLLFKGKIYNNEYKIYLVMDFYHQDILVPTQEIFGKMAGYIGSAQCTQVWMITNCKKQDDHTYYISIINNYGSEDLDCILRYNADGTFTMDKQNGSTMKFPVNGKWQKIPGTVPFSRQPFH